MNKLSLFSGIGGIDLAAEWAGMKTVAFCEREPFPQKVLRKHWPDVPIYDDVCELTAEKLKEDGIIGASRTIDIISAGYPCQPFSVAGNRAGKEDDRHLWPEVARLLREIRPRWFVGENVAGHITLGLDDVLAELESIGYSAQAFVIPSSAVGAPHRRDRVFIVAYTDSVRNDSKSEHRTDCYGEKSLQKRKQSQCGLSNKCENVAYSSIIRPQTEGAEQQTAGAPGGCEDVGNAKRRRYSGQSRWRSREVAKNGYIKFEERVRTIGAAEPGLGGVFDGISSFVDGYKWPAGLGAEQYDWEPPRVAVGVKDRVGRLKALGNAVNPVQIYPIMAAIKAIDDLYKEAEL